MQTRIILSLLALILSPAAWAGSINTAGYSSGPDAGPATADVAATVYNPAALGGIEGYHFLVDGQLNFIHIEATATRNDGIDPNTDEPYEVAEADPMVPNLLLGGAAELWKEHLVAGLTVNTPFVGGGDYSGNESNPPPYTSHQRYAGINVKIITMSVTPALAFSWEGFHVGGSVSYVHDSISALQASDVLGTEGVGGGGGYTTDSVLTADAKGSHMGWNAGVFVDRWKFAQIGVSYAGPSVWNAEGEGSVYMPALGASEEATYDAIVTFEQPLPAILRVGLTSEVNEKLRLGGMWEYQMWNSCCGGSDGDLVIGVTDADGNALLSPLGTDIATTQYSPRRLWNTSDFKFWGTYSMLADNKLTLGARVGYQQNAVPDYAVSATNLDFQSVGTMLAARYKVAGPLTLGVAYTRFFLFERTITNSAWGAKEGDPSYVDDHFSPSLPFKVSNNGTYSGSDNALGVRLGLDL